MIKVKNVSKVFDGRAVLSGINIDFDKGNIYGLVGSNGASKSTLLRIIAGAYNRDGGQVEYDSVALDMNRTHPPSLVFLGDNIYYGRGDTIKSLAREYSQYYINMSENSLMRLLDNYELDINTKMQKLSKGQKNQARIAIALACDTDYILLDETLDGLDPLMRINTKKIIYNEIANTDKIVIVTSHSLREMEDMCDYLTILHDSKILLHDSVDGVRESYVKIRCAFAHPVAADELSDLDIISLDGEKIVTMVVKGNKEQVLMSIEAHNPVVVEDIRLTLEEVFVIKMKELGYGGLAFEEDQDENK